MHQPTRHKILRILISHFLMYAWKYTIFRASFKLFWLEQNSLQNFVNVNFFFPFCLLYQGTIFLSIWLSDEQFVSNIYPMPLFPGMLVQFEHIGERLLKKNWVILQCIPYCIDHTSNLYNWLFNQFSWVQI